MRFIYWNTEGRLGNLLLQYSAIINNISKGDKVLCFSSNLSELINYDERFVVIKKNYILNKFLILLFSITLVFLSKIKIISSIHPKLIFLKNGYESEDHEICFKRGFIPNLVIFKGYYQTDEWIRDIKIKKFLIKKAETKLQIYSKSKNIVAIHVRLGDYANWSVMGINDTTIDRTWYEKAILYIKNSVENPDFIYFTDDALGLKKIFNDNNLKIYLGESSAEEFAAISLCAHAIISPSTFSYCASLIGYRKNKLIVAPKYWIGFKSKIWCPFTIESKYINYLEVD